MCVGYVLSWAMIVLLFHSFLHAPIVYVGYILSWAVIVLLLIHCLFLPPCVLRLCFVLGVDCVAAVSLFKCCSYCVCVCYVLSCAVIVLLFLPVYCCSQCTCRLCIDVGVDCVVAVFLCSVAPIGCVGYVLSWAMIVLLLFHCLLLLPLCVQVVYCPWW